MGENTQKCFQTSGDLTSELVRNIYITFSGRYRQSKSHKVMMVILTIEVLILIALKIHTNDDSLLPVLAIAGAYVLIDLLMHWVVRYGAKMTVKRFEEESHTGVRGNTSSFTGTQVYLENHDSGGSCYINLTDIKRLMQVDNLWVLVTKTAAFVPVFVEQLNETDQRSLLELLKKNNPKIKIQLSKKK